MVRVVPGGHSGPEIGQNGSDGGHFGPEIGPTTTLMTQRTVLTDGIAGVGKTYIIRTVLTD